MAQQKKVLVIESENLLAAGLLSLLAARTEFEVIRVTITSLTCLDQPGSCRPDVLVIDEALLLANLSNVIRLTERHPRLRLIIFRSQDNKVQIIDRQIVQVGQINDFFELL